MDFLKITPDPLSVDEVTNLVKDPSCGAISLFVGTTRDNFEGKIVCRLEYEAYNEMAEKEMKKLCKECRSKWNLKHIAIHHRLGVVEVMEGSVIVATSSEHRKESLDAVSYLINSLKASVPIWKREVYSNKNSEWKQNKECSWTKESGVDDDGTKIKEEAMDLEYTKDVYIKEEPKEAEELIDTQLESFENERKYKIKSEKQSEKSCQKRKFNSDDCDEGSEEEEKPSVASFFVQINASKEEMDRRIKAFQERKREELNVLNIQEFCVTKTEEKEENSCARTTAVVLRSKGSASHLKFTRVFNEWGPQTSGVDPGSVRPPFYPSKTPKKQLKSERESSDCPSTAKLSSNTGCPVPSQTGCESDIPTDIPDGIQERISNIESHLKLKPNGHVHPSLYSRIKILEDKILYLEGLSPEYFHANSKLGASPVQKEERKPAVDGITIEEAENKIFALWKHLKERQLGIRL